MKKIKTIIIICICILTININVKAALPTDEEIPLFEHEYHELTNENIEAINADLDYWYGGNDRDFEHQAWRIYNGIVRMYKEGSGYKFLIVDSSNGVYMTTTETSLEKAMDSELRLQYILKSQDIGKRYFTPSGKFEVSNLITKKTFDEYNLTTVNINSTNGTGGLSTGTVLYCNIPIFNVRDEEGITNYIMNGDISRAYNHSLWDEATGPTLPDDVIVQTSRVEIPKNMTIEGTFGQSFIEQKFKFFVSKPIRLSWDYPTDYQNYRYRVQLSVVYQDSKGTQKRTEWKDYCKENYASSLLPNPRTDLTIKPNTIETEALGLEGVVHSYESFIFRVQNIKDKESSYWTTVILNKDGTSQAIVSDDSDETVPSDDYNGQDVSTNNSNSNINASVGITGIMSYIRNGFGLLGNGNILALMQNTFTFLPSSFFTIINFYVSMLVTIAIIGAVIKFVF